MSISLRTKVTIVVLLCAMVPVVSMAGYLLKKNEEILREKIRETLSYNLLRRTAQLDGWMSDRLRELGRWSASFVVFEGVAALSRPDGSKERMKRDLTEFLRSLLGHNRVYESLFIVDPKGEILASTGEEELGAWGKGLLAGETVTQGTLSSIFLCERLQRPTLLGLQPIQDNSSRTLGFLVGRVDLKDLEARLAPPNAEKSLAFWLLDGAGHFLARAGKIVEAPGREAFPFPVHASPAGNEPSTIGPEQLPGLPGPTIYSIQAFEGPFRGYLAATLPSAVAYRTLDESRLRLLAYGVPLILFVFLLTYLMARQVLRPIRRLSDGALRVSAGDLDVRLPERGRDEIAALTRVFNEMARRVREGRDELARSNEELTRANESLERLAITDGLTGLYNHRHFHDMLQREVQLAVRESRSLTLLMLDLDRFKEYNDRWGHTAGDAALRQVAAGFRASLRASDLAFRYGGEELTVLLPACDKEQGTEVAEKVRAAVRGIPSSAEHPGPPITVSIGVATFPDDAPEGRALLEKADAALYAAKAQGRDRVVASGVPSSEQEPARRP